MSNPAHNETPSKRGHTVLILSLLALITVLGVAATLWLRRNSHPVRSQAEPPKIGFVLHLETFTVNLSDGEPPAYLRIGIDLGLEHDPSRSDKEAAAPSTSLIRDTILSVLMAAKPNDLASIEGKQKLKEQLLASLQSRAPAIGVREVYFTEFLMQR